jgi:hypothetical protein
MNRLVLLGWLLASSALVADEPPKPATLKDDELAVLFDAKSPDRAKLFARYDRKFVQIDGKLFFNAPSQKPHYYLDPVKGELKDKFAPVAVEWTNHLQNTVVQNHVKKKSNEFRSFPMGKMADAYSKWPTTTVYGWFSKGTLLEAATDPKIVGKLPEEKKKDPPRLKD